MISVVLFEPGLARVTTEPGRLARWVLKDQTETRSAIRGAGGLWYWDHSGRRIDDARVLAAIRRAGQQVWRAAQCARVASIEPPSSG